MDYKPFDYGKEINALRVPTEEMPEKYMDPAYRIATYPKIISELAQKAMHDEDIKHYISVKQDEPQALQIFEYLFKLLPPQDLFELYERKPSVQPIHYLRAAEIYDKDCFQAAVSLMQQETVPNTDINDIVQMLSM